MTFQHLSLQPTPATSCGAGALHGRPVHLSAFPKITKFYCLLVLSAVSSCCCTGAGPLGNKNGTWCLVSSAAIRSSAHNPPRSVVDCGNVCEKSAGHLKAYMFSCLDWHVWTLFVLHVTNALIIIITGRPHRSSTYVDAAYCYWPSSVVSRSVCHTREPCKNGCTNQDAVWVEDLGGSGEPCIRWGSRSPIGRGNSEGVRGVPL